MKEIPILLYHNIGNYPEELMEDGLEPHAFMKQMQYLSQNGLQVVTLEKAVNHISRRETLGDEALSITFDGGYKDAVENVLPIIREMGFHAAFFIIPEFIGKNRKIKDSSIPCMSWGDLKTLIRNGMEIGILLHQGRSIKSGYNEWALKKSILKDLKAFIENVGHKPAYCSFKEGVPGKSLWKFIRDLGFRAVLTQLSLIHI